MNRALAYVAVASALTASALVALVVIRAHSHSDTAELKAGVASCSGYHPKVTNDAHPTVAKDVSGQFSLADFFSCGNAGCGEQPVGVAFSGGGWKALAQHMGMVRALSTLGLPLPRTIGSNSGGTWFLLLLAHSRKFYIAVQDSSQPIDAVYGDFMAAYGTLGFENISTPTDPKAEAVVRLFEELLIAKSVHNSWLTFIAEMLNAWEPGLANKTAATPLNPSLSSRTLVHAMALAPSAYLGAYGRTRAYTSLQGGQAWSTKNLAPIPAYYADFTDGTSNMHAPLALGDQAVRFNRYFGHIKDVSPMVDALPSGHMTVGAVAGGSSAAAGFLGSSVLMEQLLEHMCLGDGAAHVLTDILWPEFNMENYAVCASGSASTCEAPHGRMIDGGFADNMGLAATLSTMQQANPTLNQFKLVASFSNSCTGTLNMSNCNYYDNSLERLFANVQSAPSGSRYPSTPGAVYASQAKGPTPTGLFSLSQQIFAETSPDWSEHGPSVFRTMVVEVTTVDNGAYGIRGGSNVTLFVLFGNVGPSCPTVIIPGAIEPTAACMTLATGMQQFVQGMGRAPTIGSYTAGTIVSPSP